MLVIKQKGNSSDESQNSAKVGFVLKNGPTEEQLKSGDRRVHPASGAGGVSRPCYRIPAHNKELSKKLSFQHKLMVLCVLYDDANFVRFLLKKQTSPFYCSYDGKNCIHVATE